MSYNKVIASFLIAIFLMLQSCINNTSEYSLSDVEITVDSLKKVYAPDSRISYWNVTISNDSNKIKVIAEVDNNVANQAIINTLESKFPKVDVKTNLLPEENNKQLITGLINNSVANLRSKPEHSAEISTQALLGTPIRILKKIKNWYLIQIPNKYIAWTDAANIATISKSELSSYKASKKIVFNKQYGFSYSKPNSNSQVVSDLVIGCILPVIADEINYYKVQYPDKRTAFVNKKEVVNASAFFNKTVDINELVKTAKKFYGIPYLWGGTSSKAIDCSGFTSSIYYLNGIILQRDASQQTKYGKEIASVPDYSKLLPGDLLFFGRKASDSLPEKVTHVGMYIGNSKFIHSSGRVHISSMDSTEEDFAAGYISHFVRSVRINKEYDSIGVQKITDNNFYKEIISN